jgi:hypothetical protein
VWDESSGTCVALPDICPGDLNGDLIVTVIDVLLVLGNFGEDCN